MFFIGSFLIQKPEQWKQLLHKIFLSFCFLAVLGVVIYFLFPDFNIEMLKKVSHGIVPEYVITRMTSVFWTPVVFSSFMAVTLLYFIYRYLKLGKKSALYLITLTTFCLLMSVSRGAVLAVCLTIPLLFFLQKSLKGIGGVLLSILTSFALVWGSIYLMSYSVKKTKEDLIAQVKTSSSPPSTDIINDSAPPPSSNVENDSKPSPPQDDLQQKLYKLQDSLLEANKINKSPKKLFSWMVSSTEKTIQMEGEVTRVGLWKTSIKQLRNHPFGLGLGKAGHIAKRYENEQNKLQMGGAATDGWYLKLALETGVLGLLLYLTILVAVVVYWYKYYRKKGYDWVSLLFVIGVFVNIQNIVSNVNDFFLFSYFYWLVFGIFVQQIKLSNE